MTLANTCVRRIEIVESKIFNTKKRSIGSDLGNIKTLSDIIRLVKPHNLFEYEYESKFLALVNHMESTARKHTIDEILIDLRDDGN